MINIQKIKTLADKQGIKYGKICEAVGKKHTYLNDIAKGTVKNVPEENVFVFAKLLGTSFEYLMDITDDPDPNFLLKLSESIEERIVSEVMDKLAEMPEEQKSTLEKLLKLPDDEFSRVLDALNLLIK
jgi:transcriptional regulator with XRE-family HTH domain